VYQQIKSHIELARFSRGLKAKALRGGAWLGTGTVAEQTVRFVRNLILARLLAPSVFGTMAVVLSVCSVLGALTEVGAREALVQNPRGSERRYVETAWWMAFGRALATYCFLFLAAPFVARFYGNPELSLLLRVALLGLLLEGAMSGQAYACLKEMKFSKWAAILNGGGVVGIVVTIILSFVLRNVWALVLGSCAESAARCLLSYVICPFLPALKWDRDALRDLLKFSRRLFGLSVLSLLFARTDVFVLAKLFSPRDLGLYTMAVFLIQVPAGFLIGLMGQVIVPALSRIQTDKDRMNRIVAQVSTLILFLGTPVLVFLVVCANPLLTVVYGQPYAAAAMSFSVAACIGLINVLNGPLTALFYASGHPNLHRRCVAVMACTTLLLVYPLAKWLGLLGGQVACLIAVIAGFLVQAERARNVMGLTVMRLRNIALSLAGGASVLLFWSAARLLISPMRPATTIACGALGCLFAYAAGAILLRRFQPADSALSNESYFPPSVPAEMQVCRDVQE
jgi:lipopolysaccharide exporter